MMEQLWIVDWKNNLELGCERRRIEEHRKPLAALISTQRSRNMLLQSHTLQTIKLNEELT